MQSLWMIAASFLFACMGVCVKFGGGNAFGGRDHLLPQLHFADPDVRAGAPAAVSLATPHWALAGDTRRQSVLARCFPFLCHHAVAAGGGDAFNYTSAIFLALYLGFAGMRMRRGMLRALASGWSGVVLLLPTCAPIG